ncbi:NPCBM/NEW2 domain-containing protein [Kibdelosporangium aridum]|uniref:Alpha-galactosidase n=1 Tax=Kibdelosporangium aridum TaxID=2030 RepID=A0A1W2FMY7_KIBAR|nr:NPCBM/NEW2 domain-containing protein [Kibdelosporangium aridum]SMD23301.1 alpha-galactosidase [Kibdelosporangium aridum]
MKRLVALAVGLAFVTVPAAPAAQALPDKLALTPPMGFNNWNATGCAIDEKLIKDTADIFVTQGLKDAGYQYVNIDDCWAAPQRDANGRLTHHPERFPSGIKAIADYVHSKGLKLGIYTSAGTQTCAKTMPGALDHEEVDAQTFADWGVDYLKYDNCNNENRPALERYTKMRDALKKTGRDIVYSICEWGQNKPWEWGADVGHLWRTTGDINDTWPKVVEILKKNAPLAQYAKPGAWNDPDMLEVGNGGMTETEYRSHFSLWAMMAAPLLIGADLRKISPANMDILRNKEIIALDQDRLGVQARVMSQVDGKWVFVKPLANGDTAVALFNENDTAAKVGTSASALGLPRRPGYTVRDLWQHKDFQTAGEISAMVPAHGTVVYRVSGKNWWNAQPLVSAGLELGANVPGIPARITPVGRAFEATVTATNHAVVPVINPRVRLTAPPGWRVEVISRQQKWVLRTGESISGRWRIWPAATGTPELTSSVAFGDVTMTSKTELIVPRAVPRGTSALGDVPSAWESGGYGPVERDMSNGGWQPGDGKPLTINGNVYAKGLGAHAPTQMVFYLDGKCSGLTSIVGIDDDRNDANKVGSASFEIWADGAKVADSGVRTWRDDPISISAALAGATYLRLVVTDGGDTYSYDRGDWANPTLTC